MANLIQVGLAAPSIAARMGLRVMLDSDPTIQVTAEAGQLTALVFERPLDVLIVMGEELWLQAEADADLFNIEQVQAILVLTENPRAVQGLTELPVQAWGLLPEDATPEELTMAVQALHQGLTIAPAEMLAEFYTPSLLDGIPQATSQAEEVLTDREIEVLQLLAQGLANKQIAQVLNISTHTVKFHVSSIYNKLGATNRTEAVRNGVQRGLILL